MPQQFLEICEKKFNLGHEKYRDFLIGWARSLESYGTPLDFVNSTTYLPVTLEFPNLVLSGVNVKSDNREQRHALMRQQKIYNPLKPINEYPSNLDFENCFLCQNIAQSFDAQENPEEIKDNLMYDLGNCRIMANRYPSQPGHSLIVPIEHDRLEGRIVLIDDGNGHYVWNKEEGKTLGHALKVDELETIVSASDKYNATASTNHVLDSMSIAQHWHYQFKPNDLPCHQFFEKVVSGKKPSNLLNGTYSSENTPFDTIIFDAEKVKDFNSAVCNTLQKLEENFVVYTALYSRGNFFITPRINVTNQKINIGSSISVHWIGSDDSSFKNTLGKYLPLRGEFNWKKFI